MARKRGPVRAEQLRRRARRAGLSEEQIKSIRATPTAGQVIGDIGKEILGILPRLGLTAAQLPFNIVELLNPRARKAIEEGRAVPTRFIPDIPLLGPTQTPFNRLLNLPAGAGPGKIAGEAFKATGEFGLDLLTAIPASRLLSRVTGGVAPRVAAGGQTIIPGLEQPGKLAQALAASKFGGTRLGGLLQKPVEFGTRAGGAIARAAPPAGEIAAVGAARSGVLAGGTLKGFMSRALRKRGIATSQADDLTEAAFAQITLAELKSKNIIKPVTAKLLTAAGVADDAVVTLDDLARAAGLADATQATSVKTLEALTGVFRAAQNPINKLKAFSTKAVTIFGDDFGKASGASGQITKAILDVLKNNADEIAALGSRARIKLIAERLNPNATAGLREEASDLAIKAALTPAQTRNVLRPEAILDAFLRSNQSNPLLSRIIAGEKAAKQILTAGETTQQLSNVLPRLVAGEITDPQELKRLQKTIGGITLQAQLGPVFAQKITTGQRRIIGKLRGDGVFGSEDEFRATIKGFTKGRGVIDELTGAQAQKLIADSLKDNPVIVRKLSTSINDALNLRNAQELLAKVAPPLPGEVEYGTLVRGKAFEWVRSATSALRSSGEWGSAAANGLLGASRAGRQMTSFYDEAFALSGAQKFTVAQIKNFDDVMRNTKGVDGTLIRPIDGAVEKAVKLYDEANLKIGKRYKAAGGSLVDKEAGFVREFELLPAGKHYRPEITTWEMWQNPDFKREAFLKLMEANPSLDPLKAKSILVHAENSIATGLSGNLIYGKGIKARIGIENPFEAFKLYSRRAGHTVAIQEEFGIQFSKSGSPMAPGILKLKDGALKQGRMAEARLIENTWNAFSGKNIHDSLLAEIYSGQVAGNSPLVRGFRYIGGARGWQQMSKLGLAQITNLGGRLNNALLGNLKTGLRGQAAIANKDKALYARIKLGLMDDIFQDSLDSALAMGKAPQKFMRWTGFNSIERQNRISAFWTSRYHTTDWLTPRLRSNNPQARKWLLQLFDDDALFVDDLIKGSRDRGWKWTEDELDTIARAFVDKTQFRSDVLSLPLWASSPQGKFFFQFKTFIFNHSKLLARTYKDSITSSFELARVGRNAEAVAALSPIARHVGTTVIGGEIIADLRALASGRPRSDIDFPGAKSIPDELAFLKRAVDNMLWVGGFGIFHDIVTASDNRKLLSWMAGPSATDIVEVAQTLGATARTGNFETPARRAFQQVPVLGRALQPRLLPTQRQERARQDVGLTTRDFEALADPLEISKLLGL